MNWNSPLQNTLFQSAVALLLCAAILLGLFLPSLEWNRALPGNPLENGTIRDISILKMGSDVNPSEDIPIPDEIGAAPEEPEETEQEETQPPEEAPEETKPEETVPEESDEEEPDTGDEDEGNDDGDQGEEGGEMELNLAAVMTWYKYGTDPQAIACGPSGMVAKTVNTAQLVDSTLKYDFAMNGPDAKYVDITSVEASAGDNGYQEVPEKGSLPIELPDGNGKRNYTFLVTAAMEKPGEDGQLVQQELTFTFVLKCEYNLDLDLELTWQPREGNVQKLLCGPDKTERFPVKNSDLTERVFGYSLQLTGSLAEDARITDASYITASGQKSGNLAIDSGTLILDPAPGSNQEVYYLTFTVRTEERDVLFTYKLTYQETLDAQLAFHWMEKGVTQRTKLFDSEETATLRIKNNQLSAGALAYEMELTGTDGENGRILSVAYTTASGGSGNLEASGSLPMSMPEGMSSNTYRITVNAMVNGQRVKYELVLEYSADVSLQMSYTLTEEGTAVTRQILCENTRSKTAEPIYDDQLTDGILSYSMTLMGEEAETISITSVTCYQSGSGRVITLNAEGQLILLLKNGQPGENTFEIKAEDAGGNTYRFTINIPYKHRGENNIQINTNLVDGQKVINDTKTNLTVRAWSEDGNGNVLSYIPANGTDTKLIVMLDGEMLSYVSSSGAASEYDLYPANPEIGDTNTHTLYIYAEDALGNYGELTLTLQGERRESGQQIGKATIYVDMTSLGLGVVTSLTYDVLADEPVSYVVAKAIMGMDTGEPFGAAENTLGWPGRYAGTLDIGFYLQSLTTGHTANALENSTWPGSTEAEVLAAIDARFGAGTGLAILWRCLYRNGLNKSSGSGNSFGEFDYTSGSGWVYSIGGTYYPGQGTSSVYLQDGDVLIVRYTLAYGWDVGGGTDGYGSTVGYCVTALNGSFRVNHRMETVQNPDGSMSNVCHCCGIVEDCVHANITWLDLEDGTHIQYCQDCRKEIGDPADHSWIYTGADSDRYHRCEECDAAEAHNWKEVEGSNTATCTEAGTLSEKCQICNMVQEKEAPPNGHSLDNKWQVTEQEHYEKCSVCNEVANQGRHQYQHITYVENGVLKEDYECKICHAFHIDTCFGSLTELTVTCQKITYHCGSCYYEMDKEGVFDEYHSFVSGNCEYCGTTDPNGGGTEPPATEPPETEPPVTEPPETEPPVTEPPATEPPVTDPPVTDPPATDPVEEPGDGETP